MQDEVVVEQKKAGTANEHQDNLYTKLAAGSGLSDIEAIEVDWLAALMEESDAFVDLSDPEVEGRWLDWKTEAATTDGRRAHRLRHRHRPGGHLLPRRPVREGRAADRPRGGRRALRDLGRLLRGRPPVRQEGPRRRLVRRLRRHRAGDDQPGRVLLRGRGQHRHRRRQPRGQGGLRHRHLAGRRGPVHQARPVERGLDGVLPERRLRHDGLPGLDARRHRGQRRGRRGLGHRQRLPRRRRQLGRLLPHRARSRASTRRRPRPWPSG